MCLSISTFTRRFHSTGGFVMQCIMGHWGCSSISFLCNWDSKQIVCLRSKSSFNGIYLENQKFYPIKTPINWAGNSSPSCCIRLNLNQITWSAEMPRGCLAAFIQHNRTHCVVSNCVLSHSSPNPRVAVNRWKIAPLRDWLLQRHTAGCAEKVEPVSTFVDAVGCIFWPSTAAQTAAAKTVGPHSNEWETMRFRQTTWFGLNTASESAFSHFVFEFLRGRFKFRQRQSGLRVSVSIFFP